MNQTSAASAVAAERHTHRIASVGFINAKPLIWGLEREADVSLKLDVPSRLLGLVEAGDCDVGLLPVIDYQKRSDLLIVPAGGIGCDGHTLTVRLFAQRPIDQITTLACDPDSHTSVALARIILAKRYGVRPKLIDLTAATGAPDEARLLIGDKVVCEEPIGFEVQLDLGHAWKELTGLPFVFAVWMARRDVPLGDLPARLARAREQGLANVDAIVKKHAIPRGWPAGIALQYLTVYLKYEIGEPQLQAIRLFHEYASKLKILPHSPQPLRLGP
jgi:chorismate dehydratase